MIDGPTYRLGEELARRSIHTWELAQIHHVAFEHQAFPRGIQSLHELPQIMNIMQENRFDLYTREWMGFTDEEIELLVDALVEYCRMCLKHFPSCRVKLPLSTMVSALSIYLKLRGGAPDFKNVLELGPGSGNLAFFLKHHKDLQNYSTVEACEAYYLLQSLVYSYNFPYEYKEHAFPNLENSQSTFTICNELENPDYLEFQKDERVHHYPWWKLGVLAAQDNSFDLVTSNANLMEFSERALRDYLALIKKVMKPEGLVLSQCLGGQLARKPKELIEFMKRQGFGALLISPENYMDLEINGCKYHKYFPLRNAVFVIDGHPLYEKAMEQMHFIEPVFYQEDERLAKMFGLVKRDVQMIPVHTIIKLVENRISH